MQALRLEQVAYLRSLCESHANATDVHRWLTQYAPDLSYDSVLTWYNREYPPGRDAAAANSLISAARGINCIDAHAASLAAVVELVDQLQSAIAEAGGLRNASPSLLSNLVDLLREQRQSANQLHQIRLLEDRKGLILSGAYRLAEIMQQISRDTDCFDTVRGVLEGAIAKIESEIRYLVVQFTHRCAPLAPSWCIRAMVAGRELNATPRLCGCYPR